MNIDAGTILAIIVCAGGIVYGYGQLNQRLTEGDKKFENLEKRLDAIELRHETHEDKMEKLRKEDAEKTNEILRKVDVIQNNMEWLKKRFTTEAQ